ncbi:hypothetical protein [Methanobacterium alcaliphilum]|uniref:hypothetical protein n=1 Tax=Methanobacterium alcaliphilum TaxID=392018 RepID=UPI00200AD55C|nr:hypothetical protein [Methanobacterium alcaliphilum]MCK9151417.1 hypothetical protein [Methanobacterium alcaliphilum]
MAVLLDPVIIANLFFCIVIVILSFWAFKKIKNIAILYIGAAFGLFGISHLAVIIGYESSETILIIIRGLAYVLVIIALIKAVYER